MKKVILLLISMSILISILSLSLVYADWQNNAFIRGDANQIGLVDTNDADFILRYLFMGGQAPKCLDSADWNDDGRIDISDAIGIYNYCDGGCGGGFIKDIDRTPDKLDCKEYNN